MNMIIYTPVAPDFKKICRKTPNFLRLFSDIYNTIRRNQSRFVNTQVAATKQVQEELIEEELR